MKRPLRLRGISGEIKGQVWESDTLLRAGRLASLEIVLDDSSVSRRHAEVRHADDGWSVRDLDSTNGTYVNGVRIGPGEQPLKAARHRPVRQGGGHRRADRRDARRAAVQPARRRRGGLDASTTASTGSRSTATTCRGPASSCSRCSGPATTSSTCRARTNCSTRCSTTRSACWTRSAGRSCWPRATGRSRNCGTASLAVGHGRAARPVPLLEEAHPAVLRQRRVVPVRHRSTADDERSMTQSIADGAMASVLCVLLRTPRKRLGVLHLDRGFMAEPVHRGRPAPGRRPGRARVRGHRERAAAAPAEGPVPARRSRCSRRRSNSATTTPAATRSA